MEPDLSQGARSRRAGILLVTRALGYITAFVLVARMQADPDVGCAAAFGAISLAVGIVTSSIQPWFVTSRALPDVIMPN
jgi:hypothetical protein